MTLTQLQPILTDEVTLTELAHHERESIRKATSRYLDILMTTIQRENNGHDEELTALEYELFKLSRSLPVDLRRSAWDYKREHS